MSSRKRLPRSPYLNPRFGVAVRQFGLDLLASQSIKHNVKKGEAREESLADFFRERLPSRYAVAQGEVVDLNGGTSPQLDLMFYDQSESFAFTSGSTAILAAESLLASVEVKSKLSNAEISKCISSARKLRALSPYGKPLAGKDVGKREGRTKSARYLHCVFAYDTDLSEDGWLTKEALRFSNASADEHLIDLVYVLNRGVINLGHRIGRIEDDDGGAVTNFYFSVLNFIQREAGRRADVPFERYTKPAEKAWNKL